MALSIKAFSVQRSAFSVQRSAFSVQRSAFHALALSIVLLCCTLIDSARAADNPAIASPADTPDFVNGKWLGTIHTQVGNGPVIVTRITKQARKGAPCKTVLENARDENGNLLICLNDTSQSSSHHGE
jgi:hypothetical protein